LPQHLIGISRLRMNAESEWLNCQQHVRRTEWRAVLGDRNDADCVLLKILTIPKISRPDRDKIDEETKTYVKLVFAKLRNINLWCRTHTEPKTIYRRNKEKVLVNWLKQQKNGKL